MITTKELQLISQNPDPVLYDLKGDREALIPEMKKAGITTRKRIAPFVANVVQETDRLKTLEEYGEEAYYRSFLGDEWEYHGRGYLMNTWRAAYANLSKVLGVDLVKNPDLLANDKELAARAATWYWKENGLNWYADNGTFRQVCGVINAGDPNATIINGLAERQAAYTRALSVLTDANDQPMADGLAKVRAGTNSRKALDYLIPLIGYMRYWVWETGTIPDAEGAYAVNLPAPRNLSLRGKKIFCAGVSNLARRAVGKVVPHRGNQFYDGGIAAYFDSPLINRQTGTRGFFSDFQRPFDLELAKRWARETGCMVLLGRPYNGEALSQQGHVALLLPSGYVVQSFQTSMNGLPGLNWDYTVEQSHDGGYYTTMVHPSDWIEHNKGNMTT